MVVLAGVGPGGPGRFPLDNGGILPGDRTATNLRSSTGSMMALIAARWLS
jgi:hypothetical protein